MSNIIKLDDTGERMIPNYHKGTVMYAEHMTRYMSAVDIAKNKTVLDIASGSGYGTKMLSEKAQKVYGVDVDGDSIKYAKENFPANNIEYLLGDGESIPLKDSTVDLVVTLETIEHIENYKKFISEIKRVMKDDGMAVISTPNKSEFTQGNHFHLHEFEYDELFSLLKKEFKYIDPYFQATWVNVAIASEKEIKTEGLLEDIQTYNMKPLSKNKYLYFYFLCSNKPIKERVTSLNAFGGHYSARELVDIQRHNDRNVENYKIVLANAENAKNDLKQMYEGVIAELNNQIESKNAELSRTIVHQLRRVKRKVRSIKKS